MGLVVAVVMPQYSVVTQLQRAFCSHAPSQKHWLPVAKVDQLGFSCSPLVIISPFLLHPHLLLRFLFLTTLAQEIFTKAVVAPSATTTATKMQAGDADDSGLHQ